MGKREAVRVRHLGIVLGDQLDPHSALLGYLDPKSDAILMAEVTEEATHVWSHKARIALFLSAMRHYRDWLKQCGHRVIYRTLEDSSNTSTLEGELARTIRELCPEKVLVVEPGEWRVEQAIRQTCQKMAMPLEVLPDQHFLCSKEEFAEFACGRKQLRLEFFYRRMRKKTGVLMHDGRPVGGQWNFDAANRRAFGPTGPQQVPPPLRFTPDGITRKVLRLVNERFANHPGTLDNFAWPVTPQQAQQALKDFLNHRLSYFGPYQDAMWAGEPFLYHSLLSSALNLKLLNPWDVLQRAEEAYRTKQAPLNSVEGFIRQILGWREYVRGIYWLFMPGYIENNYLQTDGELPRFYWTGNTDMECLRQTICQTLDYGYAHHIQRLMVTGLFALLLGVHPKEVHKWYLAVYVDAVEWVELPNTLGMSQFGDGGLMASKPYAATGKYIQRMSNYCRSCPYNPGLIAGDRACPFTVLYWDFLARNRQKLASNARMGLQLRNLERWSKDDLRTLRCAADRLRARYLNDKG